MDKEKKAIWTKNYRRTWKGMIIHMYDSQKQRCKNKPHCLNYTLEEFRDWCELSSRLSRLWINWKKSGYFKNLKPSIDRMDPKGNYDLANIQALTWEQNNKKGAKDKVIL